MIWRCDVREVKRVLERAGFENKSPVYDDGRMSVEEGHLALEDERKCSTRTYLAPYGLEEIEFRVATWWSKAECGGTRNLHLMEYKTTDPATPSPLSIATTWDKRSLPVEFRLEDTFERERPEVLEGEVMAETLSEPENVIEIGATLNKVIVAGNFSPGTTREMLQDLSGEKWADTATPLLGSPQKNLELQLGNEPSNMTMILLSAEGKEKNTFEGNKTMFLNTLDQEGWQEFLSKIIRKLERKVEVDEFKEEWRDTVVEFGEPIMMGTGLDKAAREYLLNKVVHIRETRPNAEPKPCKDSSTLKKKKERKEVKAKSRDKDKSIFITEDIFIPKTREGESRVR